MRILAGAHKGRKILSPPRRSETRPITGSVKKSLFGMLGDRVDAARVLDLYCGTGTLGLEALSCGARVCCFAERGRAELALLRRNIENFALTDRSVIWCGDVVARLAGWLAGLDGPANVAFVDPPYRQSRRWSWPAVTRKVFSPLAECLSPDGVVVLRLPRGFEPPARLGELETRRLRRYGEMVLALLSPGKEAE